ncbi:MAG: type II secretion system F family protein [Elusimicrobia bacterium]|nr:type II secretion system F family protein [Elusimicrobiota bacterium]
MLMLGLLCTFLAGALLVFGIFSGKKEERPSLRLDEVAGASSVGKKQKGGILQAVGVLVRPLVTPEMRRRLLRDLSIAQWETSPEAFFAGKIVLIVLLLLIIPRVMPTDLWPFAVLLALAVGFVLPEILLRGRIQGIKTDFARNLPDVVDLLGLCVSAGLDFMMALKWVVEKSTPNAVTREMNVLLQEISVGKPRREALRDLARKFELPDLSTFVRTLIQADKMGTSVSEALNILSEDMRIARFRQGEAIALKAPMKMLVPLLFFIFPVVGILVAGPIFLEFMTNNPIKGIAG